MGKVFQVLSTILYSATYLVAAMFFLTQWQTPPVGPKSLFGPKVQLLIDMFGIVASTVLLFGVGLQAVWVDAQDENDEEFNLSKEHTRDASGMLLFVMVIASAAGDTGNFWMSATACLLGACRLLSKWEYVVFKDKQGRAALDTRDTREASPIQNFVVSAILILVLGNEIDLGTRTIGYLMLGTVAALHVAIGVYKLASSDSNLGRIQFEATVMSVAHFAIISFYALQIDAPRTLATAVAVAVADGLANISTESSKGEDKDAPALLEHLLGAAVSVGSTVISYILFQEYAVDLTWLSVVSTISLCAAVARTLTNLTSAFEAFEGKRRQTRLYGYIGNGATLSLCVAGAIQLVYAVDHEKNLALSVGAVLLAVLNRVADFFQFPEVLPDKKWKLPYASDNKSNPAYFIYKRVQMVVLLGGAFTCMLMTTIGEGGVQWVELMVTIGLGVHALSAVLSLFQGCIPDRLAWLAVSSMEVVRLPVSTLLVGLLSVAADKNTVDLQVLALSLYIVADMVGRFFL